MRSLDDRTDMKSKDSAPMRQKLNYCRFLTVFKVVNSLSSSRTLRISERIKVRHLAYVGPTKYKSLRTGRYSKASCG